MSLSAVIAMWGIASVVIGLAAARFVDIGRGPR